MKHLDDMHDQNERALRENLALAEKIVDEELRQSTIEFMHTMHTLITKRIERGVYAPEEVPLKKAI